VNIGGMALRDGVLLQSERYWAAAVRRKDGVHVTSGEKAQIPGRESMQQVPVLRGLLKLGEAFAVLPAVRRSTGGPVLPQEEPRILAASLLSAAGMYAVRHTGRGSPLLREIASVGISLAPLLLLLRDSRLARYHGAEHKSIAAYEAHIDPSAADKEHARCGSNLIAPMIVTTIASNMLLRAAGQERQPLATFVAGLVSIGTAVELFQWMGRHQDHPLARTLRRPGIEMQRLFTTCEPSEDQLDVADLALQELLRLEEAGKAAS
jgi:uncharacterized protein YqhQ